MASICVTTLNYPAVLNTATASTTFSAHTATSWRLTASLPCGLWRLPCYLWASLSLRVTDLSTGYGPLYGIWASLPCGLWASLPCRLWASLLVGYGHLSLRVTGLSLRGLLASLFAGYGHLSSRVMGISLRGLWASLPCGLWASLPCGLWASLLAGYGYLSLRVTGLSPCGLLASPSAGYWPLSLRVMGVSPLRVMGISPCGLWAYLIAGYWPLSLPVTGLSPCGLWASLFAGYGHLSSRVAGLSHCGLLASLFAGYWPTGLSWVAGIALSTIHGCGSASSATLAPPWVTGLSAVYGQLSLLATPTPSALAALCLLR
jgi:hypothetical protein